MRKVLIVGAGQSGLQLGLMLLSHDYDVTIMSARTPEEISNGQVTSTQCMFTTAVQHERAYGINVWDEVAPRIAGVGLSVAGPDGDRAIDWLGMLDDHGQSIDQRVKMSTWLEMFEDQGGKVVYHGVMTSDLDALTRHYELVLVAAGKGELVQLFDRVPEHSPYTSPQRILSVSYVHGAARPPQHPDLDAVRFSASEAGELIVVPGYTFSGPCEMPYFEGLPGGPLDCWDDRPGSSEHWKRMLDLIRRFFPWEYDRFKDAELTDPQAILSGAVTPAVRRPVGELPSGGLVLGMADVVVVNDPISGQGSNNASKCAVSYLDSILRNANKPFDRKWMENTFNRYWADAQYATRFSNFMLRPLPEHVRNIFAAAEGNPAIGHRFVNGFDNPRDFGEWFIDQELAEDYLRRMSAG